MKTASITNRLAGLGGAKWDVHLRAREKARAGADIIEMTIGEPDVATPDALQDVAIDAIRRGRTAYSEGRGEGNLLSALADHYTTTCGRRFTEANVLCLPGTQTALYTALMGMAEHGDDVLVGDPMYATYEGVVRATGANMVPVPLDPAHGFRMQAEDVAARITPRTRALLLTSPHNPTGAVMTAQELERLGDLALKHDFSILSDEVYEHLVFDGATFVSPLSFPAFADRVVAVSSISKSHAAPGFRSGWCIGPEAFCAAVLPISETMLFGNQPFIADMTERAVRDGSAVADGMRHRFAARADRLAHRLSQDTVLKVHRPEAGMFALINVEDLGMDGETYAYDLLDHAGVAVMPGTSFGQGLQNWVRVALTIADAPFASALDRIVAHATTRARSAA
ncbi:MAG: pyridoxal phosphate-dependent aminotransferase [Pseudomonadota bacterium]